MNNLQRELAPVFDAAWSQIEEETTRTLKRHLAGRRVVDVPSPGGIALPGVATGHLRSIIPLAVDIIASQREVKPFVELRVPFELSRQAIDDVERGSDDSDWQPAKDAAKKLAFTEDRAIFNGYTEADSYAAGPDVLIEQLKKDETIAEADTLLLTIPNQLGVVYNAHVMEAILTTVAPALGWR